MFSKPGYTISNTLAGMCGFQKQMSIKTFYHLIKVVKTFLRKWKNNSSG